MSMLILAIIIASSLAIANTPGASAGTGIIIEPEDFLPLIWMSADSRTFYRNPADGGEEMIERVNNYAFEGEQISWDVLVMDKNGEEKISDVYVTIGQTQGVGNDIEVNCDRLTPDQCYYFDLRKFNARIGEEQITEFDDDTMAIYTCTLTVETPNSMYGEYWVVGEVEDLDGNQNTFDENEYWFFNPVIALAVDGGLEFDNVRPGSASYSDTLRISNDADDGSGVLLDMSISGTDFYDPSSSGAKCPISNRIRLNSGGIGHSYDTEGDANPANDFVRGAQTDCDNPAFDEDGPNNDNQIGDKCTNCYPAVPDTADDLATESDFDALCYFASNGAFTTANDLARRDIEGYVGIPYETGEESERAPIISGIGADTKIQIGSFTDKRYFAGNVLSPGADIALTFRLFLPEPCNGAFSDGQIYFWGEAI